MFVQDCVHEYFGLDIVNFFSILNVFDTLFCYICHYALADAS